MRAVITDSAALGSVTTLAKHAYLKSQGWVRGKDLGDRGVVFEYDTISEVFAPGSDRLADYAEAVAAVIAEIAKVENRDEISVFRDLVSADRDIIRFRAPQAQEDGSIDLEHGVELVRQSREVLLAAACSAVEPRQYFRAGSNARATEYLRSVRLGQTEHGSFVVTLISPVPPALEPASQGTLWPELDAEPFNRQVTRTLATAVDAVSSAVAEVSRGADIRAFYRAVARGVSSYLCAAIAGFIKQGNGLDFSLTWARTRPAPQPRHRREFAAADAPLLEEAAQVLKNREPRRNEVPEGYAVALNRGMSAPTGRIRLKTFVDGQPRSVAADLPDEDYQRAVAGHAEQVAIRIEGDLEFQGRRWFLKNPRNIAIIEEKEADE